MVKMWPTYVQEKSLVEEFLLEHFNIGGFLTKILKKIVKIKFVRYLLDWLEQNRASRRILQVKFHF